MNCVKPPVEEPQVTEKPQVVDRSQNNKELQTAIKNEKYDKALELIDKGLSPNTFFENGDTPLIWAIENRSVFSMEKFSRDQEIELGKFIEALIKKGADVNLLSLDGYAPLNMALSRHFDEIAILIIDQGVDWNFTDKNKFNYFESALFYKRINVLRYILKFDEAIKSTINRDALSIYFIYYWFDGVEEIIDVLMSHGFKLDTSKPLLQTALFDNNYGAVKWLLEHGITENDATDPLFASSTILDIAFSGRRGIRRTENTEESYEKGLKNSDKIINLVLKHLEGDNYKQRSRDEINQMNPYR